MKAHERPQGLGFSVWGLAAGYFLLYTPYAGLTKALTSGLLPGAEGPISGFSILPATVLATIFVVAIILILTGWWREMKLLRLAGLSIPVPRRATLLAGLGDATLIGATTMAYTFEGVSIVFMMLLMRGGVLVMSPMMDRLYRRRIRWFSWLALFLTLGALSLALTAEEGTAFSVVAAINVSAYLGGYLIRFRAMGRLAKSLDRADNLRYFAEEQMVATPMLLCLLAMVALLGGDGEAVQQLRFGFSGFFATSMLWPALIVGALYGLLSLFGTLIYLDHNENTYVVPINRSASLLAGVAASCALYAVFSTSPPAPWQFIGAGLLIVAAFLLAAGPHLNLGQSSGRSILFVCSGNTCRSAMAERLAMREACRRLGICGTDLAGRGWTIASAGVSVTASESLDRDAADALERLGVSSARHRSRPVTAQLVAAAEVVICLSPEHRDRVIEIAPWATARVHLIDPDGLAVDLPMDDDYDRFASELQVFVARCFDRLAIA